MEHTQEPWFVGETTHEDGEFIETAIMALGGDAAPAVCLDFGFNNLGMRDANAKRIVACVNACEEIPTEYLEKFGGTSFNHFKRVKNERDAAWEELRQIRTAIKANPEESTFDEVTRVMARHDELLSSLKDVLEYVDRPPTRNCSCHISPPCGDCVDWSHLREVLDFADRTIVKAESAS